jgi:hypothetical protein
MLVGLLSNAEPVTGTCATSARQTHGHWSANSIMKSTEAFFLTPVFLCFFGYHRGSPQLFDVKLYIKSGSTTIAKTQIPVWDIPLCDKLSSSAGTPTGPVVSAAAEAVARATRTSTDSTPAIPSSLQIKKAASMALSGLQTSSSDSLGSQSAPGTPKRRLSIAAGES